MHKVLIVALIAIISTCLSISSVSARGAGRGFGFHSYSGRSHSYGGDHYTHGYTRRDGTYVGGYHATNPNGTRNDNYSTRGNINPYTGKWGTKPRDEDLPSYRNYRGSPGYTYIPGSGLSSVPLTATPLPTFPQSRNPPSYASGGPGWVAPTGPRHACTHAEEVQARIARMNQYTVIPNCD